MGWLTTSKTGRTKGWIAISRPLSNHATIEIWDLPEDGIRPKMFEFHEASIHMHLGPASGFTDRLVWHGQLSTDLNRHPLAGGDHEHHLFGDRLGHWGPNGTAA